MHARHALLFGVLCVLYAAACAQTTTNATGSDESDIGANETGPNEHMMISHGWLMCISTMVLVPIGIFTQRFLNELCGLDKRIAIGMHISIFVIAVILETVGLIIGARYSDGGQGYGAHKTMGYVAYSMLLLSNILGSVSWRRHPLAETPQETGCTLHRVVGMLTLLCGAYGVFSGKGTLSDLGYGEAADTITFFGFAFHGLLWPTVIAAFIIRRWKRKTAAKAERDPENYAEPVSSSPLTASSQRQPQVV